MRKLHPAALMHAYVRCANESRRPHEDHSFYLIHRDVELIRISGVMKCRLRRSWLHEVNGMCPLPECQNTWLWGYGGTFEWIRY